MLEQYYGKLVFGLIILSGVSGFFLGHFTTTPTIVQSDSSGNTADDIVKYCELVYFGPQPPYTIPFIGQYNGTYSVYVCRVN